MPLLFWIGAWTIMFGLAHGCVPVAPIEPPRAVLPSIPQVGHPEGRRQKRGARGRFVKG